MRIAADYFLCVSSIIVHSFLTHYRTPNVLLMFFRAGHALAFVDRDSSFKKLSCRCRLVDFDLAYARSRDG
jgi:hypothetical protein